jgi:hypothetical protein
MLNRRERHEAYLGNKTSALQTFTKNRIQFTLNQTAGNTGATDHLQNSGARTAKPYSKLED